MTSSKSLLWDWTGIVNSCIDLIKQKPSKQFLSLRKSFDWVALLAISYVAYETFFE